MVLSTHPETAMFQWQMKLFLALGVCKTLWDLLEWKVLLFVCLRQYFHHVLFQLLLLYVLIFIISSDKAHMKWASVLFSHQRSDSYSN